MFKVSRQQKNVGFAFVRFSRCVFALSVELKHKSRISTKCLLNHRCIIFDSVFHAQQEKLFLQSMVLTQNCMKTLLSPLHNVMDLNMGMEDTFITVTLGQKRRDMFLRRAVLHESGIVSR